MKILFVGPLFPIPAHSGGQIATLETLRSLQALCEIHLLVPPPEHDQESNQLALQRLLPDVRVHFYPARLPRRLAIYATALIAALTRRSYWAVAWQSQTLRTMVKRLHASEAFDVVHCEWLQPAMALRGLHLPMVIRTLDVHFLDMDSWVRSLPPRDRLRRRYWHVQAKRFRSVEAETLAAAKCVVTLSTEDEVILRNLGVQNIVTIPPPRSIELLDPTRAGTQFALFLGRLDMAPNREAFLLFADEIWPLICEEVKNRARIVFAGGIAGDDIRRRAVECGIEIRGPLSDAEAARLYAEADLFLSPVRSGTGIKIKTLDAMAHGKPMIGFRGTFRGVPVENGVQAMIAETPADFARLFEQLIDDQPRRRAIGSAARDFIRRHFDSAILGQRLVNVYAAVAGMRKP